MKYYDPELKVKVVKVVEETGNLLVVARKYNIPLSTIEGRRSRRSRRSWKGWKGWRKTRNFNGSHSISRKDEKKAVLYGYWWVVQDLNL